jgi:hypothetical protein
VIAVRTLGAELKRSALGRRAGRKRPTPAEPGEETEPVAVTRVTVIRGEPLEDLAAAREWLAGCEDPETAYGEVAEALQLLNRAIHAHRVSAADPYVGDLSLSGARRVRLGYGGGDELVEGRWRDAYVVPPQVARTRRRRMLAPEEQLARILSSRRPAHPSEDLLLRARLDFDQGRTRTAALQANLARQALESELRAAGGADATRDAVRAHAELLEPLGNAALERELAEDEVPKLEQALKELERLARRRRHAAD